MKATIPIILILVICFQIGSCSTPVEKPDNLISKGDFIEILTDFYLYKNPSIQQGLANNNPNNDLNYYVLSKHKITGKEFQDSYKYYMSKDTEAHSILNEVEENLKDQAKQWKVYEEDDDVKNATDSLN